MKKRRPYKPRTPVKRVRSTINLRGRRQPAENKFLQGLARVLRLVILLAICVFLIYQLFKPEKNQPDKAKTAPPAKQQVKADPTPTADEPEIQPEINLESFSKEEKLDYWLDQIFDTYNIKQSWIKRRGNQLTVHLPADITPIELIVDIIQKVKTLGMDYTESHESLKLGQQSLTITSNKDTMKTIFFLVDRELQRPTTRLAVIIDDFGYYDNNTTSAFLELNFPITLSIIPGQKYSKKMAQQAREHDKKVMLHLPMEPESGPVEKNEFTIFTSMTDDEISERIRKALKSVPDVVAVNNHMGSKATADVRVMNAVCRELKKQQLIFVDSRTTGASVAKKVAARHALPFAERTIFLDAGEDKNKTHILNQLKKAVKIAEARGKVLIIGHPYPETIEALAEELPNIEKKGIAVVSISDYID